MCHVDILLVAFSVIVCVCVCFCIKYQIMATPKHVSHRMLGGSFLISTICLFVRHSHSYRSFICYVWKSNCYHHINRKHRHSKMESLYFAIRIQYTHTHTYTVSLNKSFISQVENNCKRNIVIG